MTQSGSDNLVRAINADLIQLVEAFRPVTNAFADAAERIAEAYRQSAHTARTGREPDEH